MRGFCFNLVESKTAKPLPMNKFAGFLPKTELFLYFYLILVVRLEK